MIKLKIIKNTNSYGVLLLLNVDKNIEEIFQFDKEFKFYHIIKFKDNLRVAINEVVNLYN